MSNLRRLGKSIPIGLPTDEKGYTGRECPKDDCLGYFKVVFGTGLQAVVPCHCPYCGHVANHDHFITQEQIKYARSVALRKVSDAFTKDLKALEFEHKPSGPFGIGISMKLKPGSPPRIHHYREEQLETEIECEHCALKYAVYGVFAFCPDCGRHNSMRVFEKSLEMVTAVLALAEKSEPELAEKLRQDSLGDCVAAFDGFGRELCRVHSSQATNPRETKSLSFQNLKRAARKCAKLFGLDLKGILDDRGWSQCTELFERRHLFAHKMGVADEKYVASIPERSGAKGRRVRVSADEVVSLIALLRELAQGMTNHFAVGEPMRTVIPTHRQRRTDMEEHKDITELVSRNEELEAQTGVALSALFAQRTVNRYNMPDMSDDASVTVRGEYRSASSDISGELIEIKAVVYDDNERVIGEQSHAVLTSEFSGFDVFDIHIDIMLELVERISKVLIYPKLSG